MTLDTNYSLLEVLKDLKIKICSFSALHWAIASSNTNAVPSLLKSGASLEATNNKGQTPSDLADERKNNYIRHKIKEEYLKRGHGSPSFLKNLLSDAVSFLSV